MVVEMEMRGELRERFVFLRTLRHLIQFRKISRRFNAEDVRPLMPVDLAEEVVLHGPREVSQIAPKPHAAGLRGLNVPSFPFGSQQLDPRDVIVFKQRVRMARQHVQALVQNGGFAVGEERGGLRGLVVEEELIGDGEKRGGGKVEEGGESAGENRSRLGHRNGARIERCGADFQELERIESEMRRILDSEQTLDCA